MNKKYMSKICDFMCRNKAYDLALKGIDMIEIQW